MNGPVAFSLFPIVISLYASLPKQVRTAWRQRRPLPLSPQLQQHNGMDPNFMCRQYGMMTESAEELKLASDWLVKEAKLSIQWFVFP